MNILRIPSAWHLLYFLKPNSGRNSISNNLSNAYNIHKSMNNCHESYKQHDSKGISISDTLYSVKCCRKKKVRIHTVCFKRRYFIFQYWINVKMWVSIRKKKMEFFSPKVTICLGKININRMCDSSSFKLKENPISNTLRISSPIYVSL